jgi:hypothetical protein
MQNVSYNHHCSPYHHHHYHYHYYYYSPLLLLLLPLPSQLLLLRLLMHLPLLPLWIPISSLSPMTTTMTKLL